MLVMTKRGKHIQCLQILTLKISIHLIVEKTYQTKSWAIYTTDFLLHFSGATSVSERKKLWNCVGRWASMKHISPIIMWAPIVSESITQFTPLKVAEQWRERIWTRSSRGIETVYTLYSHSLSALQVILT
jgi:hypothetical protein